jgi:YD repeat-containing protein
MTATTALAHLLPAARQGFGPQRDLAGRRTRITHPDGFFVQQDYLITGEMTRIRERDGTGNVPVESGVGVLATYGYDQLGRRTRRGGVRSRGGSA